LTSLKAKTILILGNAHKSGLFLGQRARWGSLRQGQATID
jgi:hypothetical protein